MCRHQKNASHTISIYGNCMISIFFKKRKPQFFITRLFYKNQTATEMSLYLFSTIFRNCMKIVWQACSHTLDVWNCMISIFGVWRSTRVICSFHLSSLRFLNWPGFGVRYGNKFPKSSITSDLESNCSHCSKRAMLTMECKGGASAGLNETVATSQLEAVFLRNFEVIYCLVQSKYLMSVIFEMEWNRSTITETNVGVSTQ